MKFKTGDKVKFLNKVGGGYVTQVLDNAMVRIISDGGLEYPVPEKELILIDPKSSIERYFDEDFDVSMPSKDELNVRHSVPPVMASTRQNLHRNIFQCLT